MKLLLLYLFLAVSPLWAQETYTLEGTEYYSNQYFETGYPKVKRSDSAKHKFLKALGYQQIPYGYEVDHIIPLSWGGADVPENMQLITVEEHRRKTASERGLKPAVYDPYSFHPRIGAAYLAAGRTYPTNANAFDPLPSTTTPSSYSSSSSTTTTTTTSSSREIHTGPRGGQYYINSNGNKTYIKH